MAFRVNTIAFLPPVNTRMTIPADELEVVEVQGDIWIVDVLRSKMDLVVYDNTGVIDAVLKTHLAKSLFVFDISVAAILPRLALIEC